VLVGIVGLGSALAIPGVAGAQSVQPYGGGSTVVTDAISDPGDPGDPGAEAQRSIDDPGTTLPFTGGDVVGLAAIGMGAVGAGLLVARARKRSATNPV
jgi:hypothetical protein